MKRKLLLVLNNNNNHNNNHKKNKISNYISDDDSENDSDYTSSEEDLMTEEDSEEVEEDIKEDEEDSDEETKDEEDDEDEEENNDDDDEDEEEEEDDEEYDDYDEIINISKSYGFTTEESIFLENLDEEEIKALSELKKTDPIMYENFIKTKEIIKDREITIQDIIKADIPNDKRANLVEQFECLKQAFPCTEEYLMIRDKIRTMYINYLCEFSKDCSKTLSSSNGKIKFSDNDVMQFKKKIKEMNCSLGNKKVLEEKLEEFEEAEKGDEKSKLKRWLTTSLSLPFDTIVRNDTDNISEKIKETKEFLNKKLYGMKNVKERLMLFLNKKLRESNSRGCNIALVGKPGVGKCLHPDTPVIMYDLTVKVAKDIKVGDILLGDDCTERRVLSIANGREEMFRVYQEFGNEYVVNKSHILTLLDLKQNKVVDIPLTKVLDHQENYSPISCIYNGKVTNAKAREIGRFMSSNVNNDNQFSKDVTKIPKDYQLWTFESKIEFLNGLIDCSEIVETSPDNRSNNIYIHNNRPIYTIIDLLRSAGIRCIYEDNFIKIYNTFNISNISNIETYEKISISSIGEGEYYGFTVTENERFVLGDWTVTHNTAIAKALSECLKMPFSQMSFGGVNNSEFLVGHDYTYIGSRPGELSRCLIRMGAKNGIVFLDEFDKASDKKDVMSALLHITDFSQNNEFRDNYFPELTQDLSKIWFIYSMNELPTDPAMLDRLEVIKVEEYSTLERIEISKNYLFPKYISELSILKDRILLSDCGIKKIVDCASGGLDKKGVRDLERYINIIIEKVYFYLSNIDSDYEYEWFKKMKSCYNTETNKIAINESLVLKVLEDMRKTGDDVFLSMYM
jgi:ATP-dependent Lon protease